MTFVKIQDLERYTAHCKAVAADWRGVWKMGNKPWGILAAMAAILILAGYVVTNDRQGTDWRNVIPRETVQTEAAGPEVIQTEAMRTEALEAVTQTETVPAPVYEFVEHSANDMLEGILGGGDGNLAGQLWDNQLFHGIYSPDAVLAEAGQRPVFYVSSSDGNDDNPGNSPQAPKRTLSQFSGMSDIVVMLKCGDVFEMTDTFRMGSRMTLAAYGTGLRPVLDYYQKLDIPWIRQEGSTDVWRADISGVPLLNDGKKVYGKCNIGHLSIDGEYSWKRVADGADYVDFLQKAEEQSWGIDRDEAVIYLRDKRDPNTRKIYYAIPVHGIVMANVSDTEVKGVEIRGAGLHGIQMTGVTGAVVKSCYIHHIGGGLFNSRPSRYGNAIEIWDNASGVEVSYNMAEWIYDTCYTNQGDGNGIAQKNLRFYRNIGRYSFWGIESWGNKEWGDQFENIVYDENILMNACDVTAPLVKIYVNVSGQNVDKDGNMYTEAMPYVTYRTGYPFHQMSLFFGGNASRNNALFVKNNVFWDTNRYLCVMNKPDGTFDYPFFSNNLFYAALPTDSIAVFRQDVDGGRNYMNMFPLEDNTAILDVGGRDGGEGRTRAMERMKGALNNIS